MSWSSKIESIVHVAFWVLLLSLLISMTSQIFTLQESLLISSGNLSIMAGVAYFNIYFIIPRFFEKGKFGRYFFALMGLLVSATFIHFFFSGFFEPDFSRMSHSPPGMDNKMSLRFRFVPIFFFNVTILFISTVFKLAKEFVKKEHQSNTLEKEKIKHELNFLRSQINPHFLFNALNNLHATVQLKPEKASEYILKLGDMLRYVLEDCNQEKVRLTDEISYIQNYIFFQQQKDNAFLNTHFEVCGSDPDVYKLEPMLLIPLVENAFQHSYVKNVENQWVDICLSLQKEKVKFTVKNNLGENQVTNKCGFGVGLQNIHRRLELLYPNRHYLKNEIIDEEYFAQLTIFQ